LLRSDNTGGVTAGRIERALTRRRGLAYIASSPCPTRGARTRRVGDIVQRGCGRARNQLAIVALEYVTTARGHGTRWTAETGRARACRRVDLRTEVLAEGLSKPTSCQYQARNGADGSNHFFRTPEEVVVLGEEM